MHINKIGLLISFVCLLILIAPVTSLGVPVPSDPIILAGRLEKRLGRCLANSLGICLEIRIHCFRPR